MSTLRKVLGEPWIIHTVPAVGYRVLPPGEAPAETSGADTGDEDDEVGA
jgi:two-component system response regulator VanR